MNYTRKGLLLVTTAFVVLVLSQAFYWFAKGYRLIKKANKKS